jgi:hypothetical protein
MFEPRKAQERELDGFGDEFAVGVAAKSSTFEIEGPDEPRRLSWARPRRRAHPADASACSSGTRMCEEDQPVAQRC